MDPKFDSSGTYVTVAGLVVSLAAHFGFSVSVSDVLTIIGAVVVVVGVIKQYTAHKNLAIVTGTPVK